MSLKEQLEQFSIDFTQKSPEYAKIFCEFIDSLRETKMLDEVLKEGDTMPDFALPNIAGKIIDINSIFRDGKIIITFYRGGWCPYCSLELQSWEAIYPDLMAKNVNLVAISPEKAESASMSGTSKDLSFEALSDVGNDVARKFGLVFELTPKILEVYMELGIDLAESNGDQSGELPIPATYIVGKDRKILDAYIDVDFRRRKDPEEILKLL